MANFQNKKNHNYEKVSHNSSIPDKNNYGAIYRNYIENQKKLLTDIAEFLPTLGYKVVPSAEGFVIGLQHPEANQRLAVIDLEKSSFKFVHAKLEKLLKKIAPGCEWHTSQGVKHQAFIPEVTTLIAGQFHQVESGGRFF